MSFKCSIFGHKFGDPVVDREREEAGSEVVITIRETQTCSRCGEERVVSENKEVTTLETPDDGTPGAGSTPSPADAGPGGSSGDGRETGGTEPASVTDEGTGAADDGGTSPADEETETAAAGDDTRNEPAVAETDPEMDDATIIEESPERSIVDEAEPDEGPTPGDPADVPSGEAADTDSATDDAVILGDESADDAEEDRRPGEWPEEPEDAGPEWQPPTDVSTAAEADVEDEQATEVEPTGQAVTVPEGSFHCSECGFSTPVESSSLRAGDFCPDCHTGTLVHEADES